MATKTTLTEFEAVFPKLEKVLMDQVSSHGLPADYIEWYRKVCPLPPLRPLPLTGHHPLPLTSR